MIDVDYETDNPDNGNRTIIEVGVGKCASLTCNISYAGLDKQFVMHKRDGKLLCCFPFLRAKPMHLFWNKYLQKELILDSKQLSHTINSDLQGIHANNSLFESYCFDSVY